MIWNSTVAMTVIDLLVVGACSAIVIAVWRVRPSTADGSSVGPRLILAGVFCAGLFYLADLAVMHLPPAYLGLPASNPLTMPLDYRWLVTLISFALISAGLLFDSVMRKRWANALEATESRYRSIVRDQSDFIVRWQPGGIRTWVNDPYCDFFGRPREELIGTSFYPVIADADRERIKGELEALSPEAPLRTGVHRVKSPTGEICWHEWIDRALFDATGRLIEVQSVGRDITDRVETERALIESEASFRGFVENTSDWVWQIDCNGKHIYSNPRVQNILGYSAEELSTLELSELVHSDDLREVEERLPVLMSEKRGWQQWLIRFRHRDGSYRYLESTADTVLDEKGVVIGYRGIDRDATFKTLLTRISTALIGQSALDLDECIRQALGQIGTCYGVDRISLWWLVGQSARRSHEWAEPGMGGQTAMVITEEKLPLAFRLLSAGRTMKVTSLEDLPDEVEDRSFLDAQGVKSTLAIPLFDKDVLVGAAVFSTVSRPRAWPEIVESELRLLAEKIAAAYAKSESTETIIRRERDIEQSEGLAHVGSYAFYPTIDSGPFPEGWEADFSSEHCALFEIDPEVASYELFVSRVHKEDHDRVMGAFEGLLREGSEIELQYRIVNPSGNVLHLVSRTQIDRDESGRILRIVGASRDITDQVLREQSLTRALSEIEQLRDRLEEENVYLRQEIRSVNEFELIIGESESLRKCLNLAKRAAATDVSVLILGETGTGKELIAKAIHELSPRRNKRLVSLNCTALPADLVESELFGHERGAFTGAHNRRVGRFEVADGGTLFLDEIADLPVHLQGKLLRVLQDGDFVRLGGMETIHADVRLVAATNSDIQQAMRDGSFRSDLYYRVNTVVIELPPLRERKEDIPLLAQHFVNKHGPRLGKSIEAVSTRMLRYLQDQDWPGNVRELEHFIERSLISATGSVLSLGEADRSADRQIPRSHFRDNESASTLRDVERDHILRVLSGCKWNIGGEDGAAAKLGLPPSTLRSRMKRLGIKRAH